MKILICAVPGSPEKDLPFYYMDKRVDDNYLVRCPIHAYLAETLELKKGEHLKVIYLMTDGEGINDCKANARFFYRELQGVNSIDSVGADIGFNTWFNRKNP